MRHVSGSVSGPRFELVHQSSSEMPNAQKPPHCGAYFLGAFSNAARFAADEKYHR